jgi:hypothetical protein
MWAWLIAILQRLKFLIMGETTSSPTYSSDSGSQDRETFVQWSPEFS